VYLSVKTTICGGLLAGVQLFPYSGVILGLVPLEWGGLMFLFLVKRVYLSRIQLSLVSGPCGYITPICISVVGRHELVESSELSPCIVDRICLEAVYGASVRSGVEKVTLKKLLLYVLRSHIQNWPAESY
jgi:hypothetical protein